MPQEKSETAKLSNIAAKLVATPITIKVKAGAEGRLFGSVTVSDIAEAIHVPGVDKRKIILSTPIKQTGRHTANIRLHPDVTADVTIDVRAAKK